jgi:phosphatidylserine/phosphatidylglycerophosphate/cardiolipin synthase-like enzyme
MGEGRAFTPVRTSASGKIREKLVQHRAVQNKRGGPNVSIEVGQTGLSKAPGLMHNKIMILDGATVITGSFDNTWSAEHRNAENLLVMRDPALVAEHTQNRDIRAARPRPLTATAGSATPAMERKANALTGARTGES